MLRVLYMNKTYDTITTAAGLYAGKVALQQQGVLPIRTNIDNIVNNPADDFVKYGPANGVISNYCNTIPYNGYGKIKVTKLGNEIYQLADGHHRIAALRNLGVTSVRVFLTK